MKQTSFFAHQENLENDVYTWDTARLFAAIKQMISSGEYQDVTAYEAEYFVGSHFFKNPSSHKGRFTELERCKKIRVTRERLCRVRQSICSAYVTNPPELWIDDPGSERALVLRSSINRLLTYLEAKEDPEAIYLWSVFLRHM